MARSVRAAQPVYGRAWGLLARALLRRDAARSPPHAPVMHVTGTKPRRTALGRRRLPTEAEWEYAAASAPGDELALRRFPWGADATRSARISTASQVAECGRGGGDAGDSGWGCRQLIGTYGRWTASAFGPYRVSLPPLQGISQPWFGDHKVLRGGCHATRGHLIRNTWRNFYTPTAATSLPFSTAHR